MFVALVQPFAPQSTPLYEQTTIYFSGLPLLGTEVGFAPCPHPFFLSSCPPVFHSHVWEASLKSFLHL